MCDLGLRGQVGLAGQEEDGIGGCGGRHRNAAPTYVGGLSTGRHLISPRPFQPEQLSSSPWSQQGLLPRALHTQLPLGAPRPEALAFSLHLTLNKHLCPVLPLGLSLGEPAKRRPLGCSYFPGSREK